MTTYSISLDDVDLALLPLRTHKYNDFLKKEHFQFQVMKTDIVEEPGPTILYTCHICAIQVPTAFAREHTASIKHRANARIANVAAQRTRALITAHPPPFCAQPAARFCGNCAIIVGGNHEKTKEHRVAVMHDKLLWELMTAYVGNDDDDDDENYDSEPEYTDSDLGYDFHKETSSQNCSGFGSWDKVNGNEGKQHFDRTVPLKTIDAKKGTNKNEVKNETQSKLYIDDKDNKIIDNKTINNENTDTIKSSNREKTEITTNGQDSPVKKTEPITKNEEIATTSIQPQVTNYQDNKEKTESSTNVDTKFSKPKATESIKIEYIEFLTKDRKQVKVFSDYYHSFTRKIETINCIVCSSTFKNDEVDSHMFSLKHLNKMPSTLINEHCVRQINDTYSHCIPCNQMVKSSNLTKHYLTTGHGLREKQAVTDTNQATIPKIDNTVNADTGKTVNLDVVDVKAKAANVKVDLKVKPNTPEKVKNAPNEAKTSIDWPVIYPFEVSKQENTVRCVICDCQVPSNPENRKEHLVGGNHAKNVMNKRNLYPYENTNQDGIARCVICGVKVTISPENLKEHLTGLNHAKNVITRKNALRASTSKVPLPTQTTQRGLPGIKILAASTSKAPLPAQTTQQATKEAKTFASTSDTIRAKSTDYYFSWV